jgi:hypothetical protein
MKIDVVINFMVMLQSLDLAPHNYAHYASYCNWFCIHDRRIRVTAHDRS